MARDAPQHLGLGKKATAGALPASVGFYTARLGFRSGTLTLSAASVADEDGADSPSAACLRRAFV
jgi:hypothetical protein